MAEVTLQGLGKVYRGGTRAVEAVDLHVADGEFIVVVGPSGCGKSTLLRMIAGLETITEGTLLIDGRAVNRLEPAERDIAMVFQNYALYPHMTVFNNMAYGLRNRGERRRVIDSKVHDAAEVLGLSELLQRKPSQLSGGQRQRVAMGRAIVREPKVFLFDEPLSNLDAKLRVQMRLEIKRLQRRIGTTSIYVTHDQVEAMTLADRLVAMRGGKVEQIGAPMELYETPASQFVAGFIGTPPMNMLPARVSGGGAYFGEIRLTDCQQAEGSSVTVGIRPEHMTVEPHDRTPMLGRAELIERLGAETLVHVSLSHPGASVEVVVRCPETQAPEEGSAVSLNLRAKRMVVFDPDGRRVSEVAEAGSAEEPGAAEPGAA
ncbi:MAG: sn-glycerol-3-phosphate ABC transporter ATP-binding protein UgpC [Pseudomonadota bacterium]